MIAVKPSNQDHEVFLPSTLQKSVSRNSNLFNVSNLGDLVCTGEQGKFKQVTGEIVPGNYIVVLKEHAGPRAAAIEATSRGADLLHIYENAIMGYAIRIPNQTVLDAILSNPAVDYVQPDVRRKAHAQTLPTGIDRVDGDLTSAKSGDGSGLVDIDIAILDTGIDLDHPD